MADAEDRTEAASAHRLERARAEGHVPISREAAGLAALAGGLIVIVSMLPDAAAHTAQAMAVVLEQADLLTGGEAVERVVRAGFAVVLPFALAAIIGPSAAVLLQTGFLLSPSALRPDFSRLDPRRGLRRICGADTLIETGKSLLKMVVIGWVGWGAVRRLLPELPTLLGWDSGRLLREASRQVVILVAAMLAAQATIVAFDVLRARMQHARSLRMSRQELRDEHRENEGDPQIKARRRSIQRQRARRRMLAQVPKASVVLTNPTHYAVALAYERGGRAPRVVAKGVDEAAARIREIATAHRVPLVANPPLARALHRLELDAEIPAEHYQAVAEIIAYVWRLRGQVAARAA